jgi:hypothetical protein
MMHRPRGTSTIHLVLAFVLILGLIVLAYFAGTATCDGPLDPRDLDRASGVTMSDDNMYGYVSVEPRASTQLLLKSDVETEDYTGLSIEQRTHASLLESRTLMAAAISNPALELHNTKWFKSFKNPIDAQRWLERHFHARVIPDSKIVKVWLDPIDSKREARTIVMDIVNTHLDEQRKIDQAKALDRQSALNTLKIKYENRIRELSDKQNNLLVRLNMTNVGSTSRTTAFDIEFNHAIASAASAKATLASARAEYEHLLAKISNSKAPVPEIENDPQILQLRRQLTDLDLQIRSTSAATTQNSKPIREAILKREAVDEQIRSLSEQLLVQVRRTRLAQAETEMQLAEAIASAAQKRADSLRELLADVSIAMSDLLSTQEELASTREAAKEVRDELDTLQSSNMQMSIVWARYPTAPADE